jgi:hypothetical protein
MTEPRTEAGRRLLAAMHPDGCMPPCLDYSPHSGPFIDAILAIEAAAERPGREDEAYDAGRLAGYEDAIETIRQAFTDAFMSHSTGRMNDMEVMRVLDGLPAEPA